MRGLFEEGKIGPGDLSRRPRFRRAVCGLLLAAGLVLVLVVASGDGAWPPCRFHELTGYSCLTCGMTRSFAAAGRGDIAGAFQHHLFGPLILAGIALWGLGLLAEALSGRKFLSVALRGRARSAVLLVGSLWLVYGIARAAVELFA